MEKPRPLAIRPGPPSCLQNLDQSGVSHALPLSYLKCFSSFLSGESMNFYEAQHKLLFLSTFHWTSICLLIR